MRSQSADAPRWRNGTREGGQWLAEEVRDAGQDRNSGGEQSKSGDSRCVTPQLELEERDRRATQEGDHVEDRGEPGGEHGLRAENGRGAEGDDGHTDECYEDEIEAVDEDGDAERVRLLAELAKVDAEIAAMVGPASER